MQFTLLAMIIVFLITAHQDKQNRRIIRSSFKSVNWDSLTVIENTIAVSIITTQIIERCFMSGSLIIEVPVAIRLIICQKISHLTG